MKYVFKNLKNSLKTNPAVSWLYVLCTIVSVLAVLFSHGVYQNYESKIIQSGEKSIDSSLFVSFGNVISSRTTKIGNKVFRGDDTSTFGEFRQVLDELDVETKEAMGGLCVFCYADEPIGLPSSSGDVNEDKAGVFVSIIYDKENNDFGYMKQRQINTPVTYGRHITKEEYLAGEHYIELPQYITETVKHPDDLLNTKIKLFGQEYSVIGILGDGGGFYEVPFSTIPDNVTFGELNMYYQKPISTKAYKRFTAAMEKVYGDKALLPELKTIDEEEQTFYASIMLISLVLSAIAAITLAILFRFIIYTRRKSLAVLRLSGCTRNGARLMYITEGIGITAVLFVLTSLVYNKWIMPHLTVFFDKITEVYTPKTYLYIALVFLGTLFVVLSIMVSANVDKQPVDMLKKAGGR